MNEDLIARLKTQDWSIAHVERIEGREPEFFDSADLQLKAAGRRLLTATGRSLYKHQKEAIRLAGEGENVVLTTATASGKTLAFQIVALEHLQADPRATVLALYPVRALVSEQEERWAEALKASGLGTPVRRIDGGVDVSSRLRLLAEARVVVATPDVVHAWMLSNLAERRVQNFLRNLKLTILDEAHTYTGVFGSNAAFLLRRLQHAIDRLGGTHRFIAASATMTKPEAHLEKLTGQQFRIIDESMNSAPRHPAAIYLLGRPPGKDLLSACASLMNQIANEPGNNLIAFVDSRKQTEHIAAIAQRGESGSREGEEIGDDEAIIASLRDVQILPYRAGYEEHDRKQIQDQLSRGQLRGVVSTSALELGIDIPHLNVAILVGVPKSATSLYQRIGRVGRTGPGLVLVVNDGSVVSEAVFRAPETLMKLPLLEGALYLENRRIQYIHALCVARRGGEDELISGRETPDDGPISRVSWPPSFLGLCRSERLGEIDQELQSMKAEAGDDPHHVFPLRDVETSFQVERRRGPEVHQLGTLSFSQVMREAYPGAVYYYKARGYRVSRVNLHSRKIEVRAEKQFTTRPLAVPPLIYPNLSPGNVERSYSFGELRVVECPLQISNLVTGFKERRGQNEFAVSYPLDASLGYFFDRPAFSRNFFTTGVVLSHPSVSDPEVNTNALAEAIYESFMLTVAYDRMDVGFGCDRFRADRAPFKKDNKFIALYDQTYGSLRLTSCVMEPRLLSDVLLTASDLCAADERFLTPLGVKGAEILRNLADLALQQPTGLDDLASSPPTDSDHPLVIRPGSRGIDLKHGNEEFIVERVLFHPRLMSLVYRGYRVSEERKRIGKGANSDAATVVPIDQVVPIAGVSQLGHFDAEAGGFVDDE